MTDSSPFEAPSFPTADDVEDDLDDELDDDADDDADDDDLDDDEASGEDFDSSAGGAARETEDGANRLNGGTARAVLEHVARSIVDDPDAVSVDVSPDRSGVRLSLHVSPPDMGRIIGRRGRVAQALRAVVRAAAARDGTDATVDIVD